MYSYIYYYLFTHFIFYKIIFLYFFSQIGYKNMGRVKKIIVQKHLTDSSAKQLEGQWIDPSYIKYPLIQTNIDVYYLQENPDGSHQEKLLLKFRKNAISQELCQLGWKSYKDLAKASRGRGASAGPISTDSVYWKKRNLVKTKKWATGYLNPTGNELKNTYDPMDLTELQTIANDFNITISDNKEELLMKLISQQGGVSKMKVNNQVASNPIGFYEAGKNFADLPCRLTHFTRTNFDKYNQGLPFIQKINKLYKRLTPEAHQKQYERANQKSHLTIPKTSFSTITINRNFRTALHCDAGDYKEGFGNLCVLEQGKYHGGYTVFPQFGVAVDVRHGDFLAMDVHQWHSNTEIYETQEDKDYNQTITSDFHDNPEVGTAGLYKKYTRISFVCYLREKILQCPDKDKIDPQFLTKSGHNKIISSV